ncbi:protein yae1-like isoform X2 [Camellia sinensis]|uniref:protein yae1-like isoform X2 n=2 Tax=Camellia sinensis TaxID=4442 RepID=UPI0010357588|nr:protein yae1-like isoform X2 [Camellia sinensis]
MAGNHGRGFVLLSGKATPERIKMDRSFADELYSETLRLSNGELGPISSANDEQNGSYDHELDQLSHDDGSLWGSSPEEHDSLSDLDREWKRRHDQFHTIGYRDGVTAGKEASAQEGFNLGFKESVLAGYNWGLVRGVTSALTLLPDGLREKLVETQEEKDKFQSLYESVHSLSTTDALKLFHDISKRSVEQIDSNEASSNVDQSSNILQNYSGELKSLVLKCPAIEVNLVLDH